MKVWCVGVIDCENNSTVAICATKEIALREMFACRDGMVADYKEAIDKQKINGLADKMYQRMIDGLAGDDYEKWDTYPHEKPYIYEAEVLES